MVNPCVLLVEDDQSARDTITLMLEENFQVIGAVHGGSARATLEALPHPALLIADVHLPPGEQGLTIAARAAELDVPVLLMTADEFLSELLEASGCSVLLKPFRVAALLKRTYREIHRPQIGRMRLQACLMRIRAETLYT